MIVAERRLSQKYCCYVHAVTGIWQSTEILQSHIKGWDSQR